MGSSRKSCKVLVANHMHTHTTTTTTTLYTRVTVIFQGRIFSGWYPEVTTFLPTPNMAGGKYREKPYKTLPGMKTRPEMHMPLDKEISPGATETDTDGKTE